MTNHAQIDLQGSVYRVIVQHSGPARQRPLALWEIVVGCQSNGVAVRDALRALEQVGVIEAVGGGYIPKTQKPES
jgi:hypothetical protein